MYCIIEGCDGSGKDTQGDLLASYLLAKKGSVLRLNEPDSSSPTGQLLRQMLKDGSHPKAHAPMFLADRMVVQTSKVMPVLQAGGSVVSVRSFVSTLVYQQEHWPLDWLLDLHRHMPCKPTHLILLDLDPEIALGRATRRGSAIECYERLDIQKRIRQRYWDLLPKLEGLMAPNWRLGVIDASPGVDEVAKNILTWLET